jgi:hypothetical protein
VVFDAFPREQTVARREGKAKCVIDQRKM